MNSSILMMLISWMAIFFAPKHSQSYSYKCDSKMQATSSCGDKIYSFCNGNNGCSFSGYSIPLGCCIYCDNAVLLSGSSDGCSTDSTDPKTPAPTPASGSSSRYKYNYSCDYPQKLVVTADCSNRIRGYCDGKQTCWFDETPTTGCIVSCN
eukprot:379028_1